MYNSLPGLESKRRRGALSLLTGFAKSAHGAVLGRCLLSTTVFSSHTAHADLQQDVERLLASVNGATVYHLGPRVLEQGEELPLLLPPKFVSTPGAPTATGDCAHVIMIGAQSVHFSCEMADIDPDERPSSLSSRAGFIELVRCGESRVQLANVTVTMLSGRGPIEAIAFSTPRAESVVGTVLPNRAVGAEAPERTLTRQPELPRLGSWLRTREARAQLQGATRSERRVLPDQDKQLGETLVGFDPGCHELQLLADVDWETIEDTAGGMELVWDDDDEIASHEPLHTRSPTLRICTSRPRTGRLRFPALPPSISGVLSRARYDWPGGIPSHWTASVRARVAEALLQRQVKSLVAAPVRSWMGGGTSLELKVPVSPHACYVAVVAATTPVAGNIGLDVTSGLRVAADSSLDDSAVSAAFCQDAHDSVTLNIDARDSGTTWILGLWNVAPLPPGADLW